jgi:uncharacterized protein (TIGR00730 family)
MNKVAVFCGSGSGKNEIYGKKAFELGKFLAENNMELIFGGGSIGLMGAVADGTLNRDGNVTGVIPYFLNRKEVAHQEITNLIEVNSMHERKKKMHELSDGVIALPGGYGTLEEFFEMLTWSQLGLHQKPVALLNINGFYDPMVTLIDNMVNQEFLKPSYRELMITDNKIPVLVEKMKNYNPPAVRKWI